MPYKENTPDFQQGTFAKAAIGTTRIRGLNSLTIPGISRGTQKIEEFGREMDYEITTNATWGKGNISGNYVRDDETGQRVLRRKLFANEKIPDLRLYENEEDFWAPDRATDPASAYRVENVNDMEIKKSGIVPFSADLRIHGTQATFLAHLSGTGLKFVPGAPDKITDSTSRFLTAGFEVGMSVLIDNSTGNDDVVTAKITEVTAKEITLSCSEELTSEAGDVDTVIHGGRI